MIIDPFIGRASKPSGLKAVAAGRMLVCGAALCLLLPAAWTQGNGVVEGRLVNMTNPSLKAGEVDLDVVGLGGGMSIIKSATTDRSGKFRIDGLPTDSPLMIRANYKDVNYHGRVSFDSSGKASIEIPIYEPTTSMAGIRLDSARFAFQNAGDFLRSMEVYSLTNETSPPMSYMNMEGNFRFAKALDIAQLPKMSVTGPGAPMPLVQSPLESADGQYYYSLYPLRPGITTFEVDQQLPYKSGTYTFRNKFYYDVNAYEIGVIPQDMRISGDGLVRLEADTQRNFAVYRGGPVKAGTEVVWTISGGTLAPVSETAAPVSQGEAKIKPMPTLVGQKTLVLGPAVLIGFVVILWYAVNHISGASSQAQESRITELKMRRHQLLNYIASLDKQHEDQALDRREYVRQREQGKRQLRRISLLLKR